MLFANLSQTTDPAVLHSPPTSQPTFPMKLKVKYTGHAEIDRQHAVLEKLSARFNNICPDGNEHLCSLCSATGRRNCSQSLMVVAEGFLSLLAGHANYEEKLMSLLPDIPSCQEHVRRHTDAHADFALHLRALADRIMEDQPRIAGDHMHQLVTQWLGDHAAQFDEPLLANFGDQIPAEIEFDGELVRILDEYVFHGRPTGLPSHLHDNDTRQQVEVLLARLTPRQREVCELITKGLTNKMIADQFGTTVNTIKTHRSEIYRKLEVRSLLDLVLVMEIVKG